MCWMPNAIRQRTQTLPEPERSPDAEGMGKAPNQEALGPWKGMQRPQQEWDFPLKEHASTEALDIGVPEVHKAQFSVGTLPL